MRTQGACHDRTVTLTWTTAAHLTAWMPRPDRHAHLDHGSTPHGLYATTGPSHTHLDHGSTPHGLYAATGPLILTRTHAVRAIGTDIVETL